MIQGATSYFTEGAGINRLEDIDWFLFMADHRYTFSKEGIITKDYGTRQSQCYVECVGHWSSDNGYRYVYRVWRNKQDFMDYIRKESNATVVHYCIECDDVKGDVYVVAKKNARLSDTQQTLREFLDS